MIQVNREEPGKFGQIHHNIKISKYKCKDVLSYLCYIAVCVWEGKVLQLVMRFSYFSSLLFDEKLKG